MIDFALDDNNTKYGVIGSGSWATALTKVLSDKGRKVHWYIRDQKVIDHIQLHNRHCRYLQTAILKSENLIMSNDINEVVAASDVLIFAIPSAYFISEIGKMTENMDGKFIVSAVKGFVEAANLSITEYFHRHFKIDYSDMAVIGGPCHAEEVAMQRLTYMTFSCICIDKAHQLANMFNDDFIKTIATTDMHGVELAAVLKNVYAIAIGIAHGMGYGDNFQSVLVAGAYNEMIGYIDSVYPNPERIPGKSAYLGDLIVTCYSQFSRNRTFGNMIGQGYGVVSTQMEMMMVAEGYYSSKAIHHICRKKGINLPIAEAVYNILYEHASLRTTFKMLSDMLK